MTIPGTIDHEWIQGEGHVPEISDERLAALMARSQPLIQRDGKLFTIEPVDPRRTAFTWDPKPAEEALGLVEIGRFRCDHECGYHGLFKPSIAEVLSQIPDKFIERFCAYCIDRESGIDIYRTGSHQRSTVILYERA